MLACEDSGSRQRLRRSMLSVRATISMPKPQVRGAALLSAGPSGSVKGSRMPAVAGWCHRLERQASEKPQGRKPRARLGTAGARGGGCWGVGSGGGGGRGGGGGFLGRGGG